MRSTTRIGDCAGKHHVEVVIDPQAEGSHERLRQLRMLARSDDTGLETAPRGERAHDGRELDDLRARSEQHGNARAFVMRGGHGERVRDSPRQR